MIEIKIQSQKQIDTKQAKIDVYKFELPEEPNSAFQLIGVDPGVSNMGVVVIPAYGNTGFAYQISIPREPNPIQRIKNYRLIFMDCNMVYSPPIKAVIEWAAFSKQFRQAELAEARTCAAVWLLRITDDVKMIVPNSIRLGVFKDGNIKAHEYWSGLPKDCLAALSCAYYAAGIDRPPSI